MNDRAKRDSDSYRNCVSVSPYFAGGAEFMSSWNAICDQADNRIYKLIKQLRAMGVKAVHPNDGWVNRKDDGTPYRVSFCYPDFIDPIEVGDKVALKGFWDKKFQSDFVKLYEVTGIETYGGGHYNNYDIKHTDEVYVYHKDGELELLTKRMIWENFLKSLLCREVMVPIFFLVFCIALGIFLLSMKN